MIATVLSTLLLLFGAVFYLAGTVGLLRFPDTLSRLHALTKADNVGLLLVCCGIALQAASLRKAVLLMMIWLLALLASTVSAHLIARHALAAERAARSDGESG